MIVLEQGLNGYDVDGLNGGLKIAKFIKTNIKSASKDISIKNAVKVVKAVAPIALSFVPLVGGAVGGAVGKVLTKVTTNADGSANLVGRIADSVEKVANTNVGKSVVKLASPLVKNAKAGLLEQTGVIPNDAQLETLAAAKGTTPQQELDAIVAAAPDAVALTAKTPPPATPAAKDNTMLYVGGGILAVGLAYVAFK